MENMERRQDERHNQNTDSLRRLHEKLEPLISNVHSLCGDGQHPGRVGIAERDIKMIKELLGRLDKKMAVWGGVMAAFLIVIEVIAKFVFGKG